MKPNNGSKNKGINLRRWTMASIVLFSITLLLLAVVWYLGRSLETPVVWNKDISGLESTIALKNNEGFILGSKNNQLSRLDKDGNKVWQTGTSGTVKGLAVSEDELEVVAATEDRFLYIFDIATGKEKKNWAIPYPATTVAWSKDGKIAVSAGTIMASKYRIYTFDREGTQLWKFETSVAMRSLAFSPDGKILFAGTDSSRVIALNDLGKSLWEFTSKGPIYGIDIVGENVLYADHSGYVGALNFQGKPVWLTSYKENFID
jgi:outer membrane protein assembly factor BamB